ncbi:hypothetical protein POX_c04390 [Penicillium oxalicum]|uniref:hypothetical protein n=1 Tax=Penicillium oxalicum TaxID=69781 RepID=UPI0020B89F01|nr:hypothetical protein POX_c04390 [Penicillium oxalicum]KAI2791529.1 hypothetical protein POX_c04390 [Penicillium oxalicum]
MAIFDSEKRPRGLRVPSLTAMKMGSAATKSQFSFHGKKSHDAPADPTALPSNLISPAVLPTPAISAADLYSKAPPPPPTKELPPTPKEELPPLPQLAQPDSTRVPSKPSTTMPPRKEVVRKSPPSGVKPVASAPKMGLRQASQPSPSEPSPPQPRQQQQQPQSPSQSQSRSAQSSPVYNAPHPSQKQAQPHSYPHPHGPAQAQAQAPAPPPQAQPPITHSMPTLHSANTASVPVAAPQPRPAQLPPAQASVAPTPVHVTTSLEEVALTPGGSISLDPASSDDQTSSFAPSDQMDILPAVLNKVHYNCFQEHRNMPVAQNSWCPVPCMTCHKTDRQVRHRCVFCCLRICEGCHVTLQKCKGRSLTELMSKVA